MPAALERVDEPGDQRRLGADDDEVGRLVARGRDERADVARAASRQRASAAIPALPGAQTSSGARGERASARTIACSRPPPPTTRTFTDADHRLPANSSAVIAVRVWLEIVPREPSSTETLAIVCASGASTTLTKSY